MKKSDMVDDLYKNSKNNFTKKCFDYMMMYVFTRKKEFDENETINRFRNSN